MKIRLSIILMLLGASIVFNNTYAQEQPTLRQKADKLYTEYNYQKAVPLYLKLAQAKNPRTQDIEKLAECYLKFNDYDEAEKWLAQAVTKDDVSANGLKTYADVLKSNEKYTEAKAVYQKYLSVSGANSLIDLAIKGCDSALLWKANPEEYHIANEENINTGFSEFSTAVINGKVYYAAEPNKQLKEYYGRTGKTYLRVYTTEIKSGGRLPAGVILEESFNNERYHVGPVISNKKGDKLFVTKTYVGKQGQVSTENKKKFNTNNIELFIYTLKEGKWIEEPFAYNKVQEYSVGHPALSPDEKILYFVSDMPGSIGGTDIWYSELAEDGTWQQPKNAGTAINSIQNEMFPTVAKDGTLFFSSNGFAGMGGLDIFYAKGSKTEWTAPVNLHYPINSGRDDFSYVVVSENEDNINGYISSNRANGKGGDDIYNFNYIKPKIILALSGVAYNAINKKILKDVEVVLYDANKKIIGKSTTPVNGTYFFQLERNKEYQLIGNKTDFKGDTVLVSTKNITKSDTLKVNLNLEENAKFYVGQVIRLKDIRYDFNKDNIRQDAAKILDEVVQTMREHPTLEIELGSHTDSRGSDAYNLNLSQRRAKSAVAYIISKGISRSRIVAKGYGETQLSNHCGNGVECTDDEHQANRRTEIKILKF